MDFQTIKIIVGLICCLISLTGNTLTFLVYISKKFRKISTNRYLAILAISGTVSIFLLFIMSLEDILDKYSVLCKVLMYASLQVSEFNAWLLVLASADRLTANVCLTKLKWTSKFRFQIKSVLFLFIILALYNIHIAIGYDLVPKEQNGTFTCLYAEENHNYLAITSFLLLNTFIPFVLMAIFSAVLVYNVVKSKLKLKLHQSQVNHNFNREIRLVRILITINIMFFICYFPLGVLLIYNKLAQKDYLPRFVLGIAWLFPNINSNSFIFINMIFNKSFLKQIKNVFLRRHSNAPFSNINIKTEN